MSQQKSAGTPLRGACIIFSENNFPWRLEELYLDYVWQLPDGSTGQQSWQLGKEKPHAGKFTEVTIGAAQEGKRYYLTFEVNSCFSVWVEKIPGNYADMYALYVVAEDKGGGREFLRLRFGSIVCWDRDLFQVGYGSVTGKAPLHQFKLDPQSCRWKDRLPLFIVHDDQGQDPLMIISLATVQDETPLSRPVGKAPYAGILVPVRSLAAPASRFAAALQSWWPEKMTLLYRWRDESGAERSQTWHMGMTLFVPYEDTVARWKQNVDLSGRVTFGPQRSSPQSYWARLQWNDAHSPFDVVFHFRYQKGSLIKNLEGVTLFLSTSASAGADKKAEPELWLLLDKEYSELWWNWIERNQNHDTVTQQRNERIWDEEKAIRFRFVDSGTGYLCADTFRKSENLALFDLGKDLFGEQPAAPSRPEGPACRLQIPPGQGYEILCQKTASDGKKQIVSVVQNKEGETIFSCVIQAGANNAYRCRTLSPGGLEILKLPEYTGTMPVWVDFQTELPEPINGTAIGKEGEQTAMVVPAGSRYVEIHGGRQNDDTLEVHSLTREEWNRQHPKKEEKSPIFTEEDWRRIREFQERVRREQAEEEARREAEERARREAEERARREAEEKARREAIRKQWVEQKTRLKELKQQVEKAQQACSARQAELTQREQNCRKAEEASQRRQEERDARQTRLEECRTRLEQKREERRSREDRVREVQQTCQNVLRRKKEIQHLTEEMDAQVQALQKKQDGLREQEAEADREMAALRAALAGRQAMPGDRAARILETSFWQEAACQEMEDRLRALADDQVSWEQQLTELQKRVARAVDSRANELSGGNA